MKTCYNFEDNFIINGGNMKKRYSILFLVALFVSLPTHARLSCNDLDELSVTLDDLADDMEGVRSIGTDGGLDIALGELTSALNEVAHVEHDKRLSAWISDLEIAWEDMERDDFEESLDDIIDRLDDLYDRDCD